MLPTATGAATMTYLELLGIDQDDALLTNRATGLSAYVVHDTHPCPPDGDCDLTDEIRAYEAGECYGVVIADERGEHVDSCWGFYEWFSPNDPTSYIREYADTELNYWAGQYSQSAGWVAI